MTAKTAALVIGIVFIAVGLLGFIENPIIGASHNAIFHADTFHNGVHIGSGILFVLIAMAAPGFASTLMILFGIVYLLIGAAGLISYGTDGFGKVLGVLHVNGADNLLHVGLGLLILVAGIATRKTVVVS
ncbi:MAG TPA: DUF4383 domain-containing protein [Chitinophagaceae bacterium]|nr:DUF4383 domain-containing protein [Chitinophagaceae bacterium]